MLPRLYLFIVLCLSSVVALADVNSDPEVSASVPVIVAESSDQVSPQQEEARQQVISEGEDPQEQKRSEHEEQVEELVEHKQAEPVPEKDEVSDKAMEETRGKVKSEEQEPSFDRELVVKKPVVKEPLKGDVYGSIRLHYRSTEVGSIIGDAGSRIGAEAEWQAVQDTWVYARVEAGFNLLDEIDQLLSPGGGAGEGSQGESIFARLYSVGIATPVVVADFGKSWSSYYKISNFTDRFDSVGSSAVGTFNANTDGGATGTGRADGVLQTRAYIDFLPETWKVKPFNLNIQLQSDQPIPRVDGVNYQSAIGLSAVLESREDYSFGIAYNRARIDDLNNPAVQAAGIRGDAEAYLIGARWFDEQWYLGFTLARLRNHETTDAGTYFIGWGSELYTRYRLIKGYWLVAGYNWLDPDDGEIQAGPYQLRYGVVGLRYSIDEFNRLAYAEWRVDSTVSENGEVFGNIFTIGIRWNF